MRSPICSGVHASSKSNFKQKASSYITHVCECLKPYQVSKRHGVMTQTSVPTRQRENGSALAEKNFPAGGTMLRL